MKFNKSKIMSAAWSAFKDPTCKLSFSSCLSQSWLTYKLRETMKVREVEFSFQKDNKEIRFAKGTIDVTKSTGDKALHVVCYFDTEEQALRSFRLDRLNGFAA